VFAEWLRTKGRKKGRRDPSEILVTDALNDYGTERAPKTKAPRVNRQRHLRIDILLGRALARGRDSAHMR